MHDGSNNPDGFYTLASGKGGLPNVWSHPNDETVQSSDNQLHYAELYQTSGVVGYDTGFHTMTYGDTAPTLSGTGYGIGGAMGTRSTPRRQPLYRGQAPRGRRHICRLRNWSRRNHLDRWGTPFAYSGTTTINKRQIT